MLNFLFFASLVGLLGGVACIFVGMASDSAKLVVSSAVVAAVSAVLLFGVGMVSSYRGERQFMAECLQERKQYECVAIWREVNRTTAITPMPIVIPVR
ncbi:MAG TPA: hypothetical protein PK857_00480 [Hyphomicrobium sp.]|nr:hypothetical protein [Hyphomicrobium sp.]HRO48784.1 hypothetical protein [Hyphomicrobium sp.]